jgi:chromosomal replication initiator protein
VHADLDDNWPQIAAHLRRAVPDATYQIWFAGLRPRALEGDTLVLVAPDRSARWLAERFGRVLQTCAAAVLGAEVLVEIVSETAGRSRPATDQPSAQRAAAPHAGDPRHTFDHFVIGEGNRLAHAAALAVAEVPGHAYNPLFLYGPPGVGKTHLLHSIAHYVTHHGGGLTVRYTTIEAFTNGFVGALQRGSIDAFKAQWRTADVLLIDDVQFLADKARTEEEFFHTFNALYETGSQLVLTSDRLPRDMQALEQRLCERFESGLVTDIASPDFSTRMTILRKRAQHAGMDDIDEASLELIADHVRDNVRALEGALTRVIAYHSLTEKPITPDLAREVLKRLYPGLPASAPLVSDIQRATAEAFGLSVEELVSSSRSAAVAWPRQLAMYLARQLTDATLPAIGRQFGGRNHATVLYACKRADERIAADADAHATARQLQELVTAPAVDRAD